MTVATARCRSPLAIRVARNTNAPTCTTSTFSDSGASAANSAVMPIQTSGATTAMTIDARNMYDMAGSGHGQVEVTGANPKKNAIAAAK